MACDNNTLALGLMIIVLLVLIFQTSSSRPSARWGGCPWGERYSVTNIPIATTQTPQFEGMSGARLAMDQDHTEGLRRATETTSVPISHERNRSGASDSVLKVTTTPIVRYATIQQ